MSQSLPINANYQPKSARTMYAQLLSQVDALSDQTKQSLTQIYQQFAQGIIPKAAAYKHIINQPSQNLASILVQQDKVISCFGCQCITDPKQNPPSEHLLSWQHGKAYAWCIWDAFFIAMQVGQPGQITTKDAITDEPISISFDGQEFYMPELWFSFPLGDEQTDANNIRHCFCCRTKAFVSQDNAAIFAAKQHCEIVTHIDMLKRTQEMIAALTV